MTRTSESSKRPRRDTRDSTGGRPSNRSPEPYSVTQSPQAKWDLATLEAIESASHKHLRDKLLALNAPNPYAVGTLEKIKNSDNRFRVRQGDWRALILAKDDERVLLIERVLRKNEATY